MLSWLTLASTLLGMITSVIPEFVKMMARKADQAHELELIKLQMEATKQGVELNILMEQARADANEGDSLRQHDTALDGGPVINALRASIRPVITYLFFIFFLVVKGSIAYVFLKEGKPTPEVIQLLWDNDTFAIFGAIMGFHFGGRSIEKFRSPSNRVTSVTTTDKKA
jgi:hypothetical protein